MKKNKKPKLTPEELVTQARNESLPPVGSEFSGKPKGAYTKKGTGRSSPKKTVEDAPRVGDEQAP